MIKNYFKIAWRNLTKHKAFSFINITGLAVGLATTMLILLWVKDEVSMDRFHANYERIYNVMEHQANGAEVATFSSIPMPAAATIKRDVPEVEAASRISWGDERLFNYKEKTFVERGLYVDPDFLTVFTFPLLSGDRKTALTEPNTVLISEKLAAKYFGSDDPINKTIRISQKLDYKVVGVLKDVPANSTYKFDWLMPITDYIREQQMNPDSWGNNNIRTALLLKPGTEAEKVNQKIKDMVGQHEAGSKNITLFLHAAQDWYLRYDFKNGQYNGGGRITYVRLFTIVAIFVLLIACINFMNLSTARATQRAKEVGVRKVAGADKHALVWQFLGESMLLTAFAGVLAILIVSLVLPMFNDLLSRQIQVEWQNETYLATYLGILLVTSLLAGLYPAFVLSAYQPVKVLKAGRMQPGGGAVRIRQSLVVMQFTLSILLIIGTLVVYQQVNYIRNMNLGYSRDNVLLFSTEDLNYKRYELAHAEFSKVPGVESVTVANTVFNGPTNRENGLRWPGKTEDDKTLFAVINGDQDMIPTMGLQLKDGRNFSEDFGADSTHIIINEEAARRMGLKDPVGTPVEFGDTWKGTIIGVVKDFHLSSIHSPIEPTVITYQPQYTWITLVRLDGQNVPQSLAKLEEVYKSLLPGYPFKYQFLDQEYDKMYKSEMQIGQLASWFSGLAIFISCLGLFGLASFTVERRTREIGVRKVLGASVVSVLTLISREFVALVLIALLLAAYPAWYLMNDWLGKFAYHVEISWWVFVLGGLLVVGVALLTVSFQSIKAALMNPVKSLRTE
ncbi:ABC transporter permease [Telluribacter sp. SYSU D00476]|uniref:ABC transporter permease n=1 Tax=Telluribacter sp. SYSU D00476 TaxID=2811430 RepID=UPI001FF50A63|nr:ABC transporter permease [Telluribacter sp. SYSU D00476]